MKKGFTQEKLFRVLNDQGFEISLTAVRNYEAGRVEAIGLYTISAFAKALDTEIEALAGFHEDEQKKPARKGKLAA